MQRTKKAFNKKEKKVARDQVLRDLLSAFENLQGYELKSQSDVITKEVIKRNDDGKEWKKLEGISIQTLEANLSEEDKAKLNQGYSELLPESDIKGSGYNFKCTLSDPDQVNQTRQIRITPRLSGNGLTTTLGLDPAIVAGLNYRQRLMMNDIVFSVVQTILGDKQDQVFLNELLLHAGSVINQCLAGKALGLERAGEFTVNSDFLGKLRELQQTAAAAATAAPGSPSLRGLFSKVATRLRSQSQASGLSASPATVRQSDSTLQPASPAAVRQSDSTLQPASPAAVRQSDSTLQRVKPSSISAPEAMSGNNIINSTPSQRTAISLAILDRRSPEEIKGAIIRLAEELNNDTNITDEQKQCIVMLEKMQRAFAATTTPRSDNSAQLDLIKQCLVAYEIREKTPYHEKLETIVGLIEHAKLTNSQFKDKCGEFIHEYENEKRPNYSPKG